MGNDRSAPADRTLIEVIGALEGDGWTGQFQARPGGVLRCLTCRREGPVRADQADGMTRLEGASDPADMAMVVALRCPDCGARGTLVARYGPEADPEDADVLLALETPAE